MTLLVGSIFHMTRKIVSEMTYNVSMGTFNPTIPIPVGDTESSRLLCNLAVISEGAMTKFMASCYE